MTKNEFILDDKTDGKTLNYMDLDGNFYILGEFDKTISQNVIPNLVKKIDEEEDKPNPQIWFYINSNGGYCHELYNLLALIDIAKAKGIKIYTVNMGRAYSCGSLLAIHGDHRAMYKYARHLMHLGSQGDDVHTFKQIDRTEKQWKEHFENIVKMYKDNTKMPESMIRKELEDDGYFMNADECKKYGFVDEIIGEERPIPEVKVARGDTINLNGMIVKVVIDEERDKKEKEKLEKKAAKKATKKTKSKESK